MVNTLNIGNHSLGDAVYVIAEVGGNHNGDPDAAYRLVEAAAAAGANAVKFQTYKAETLVHPDQEPLPIVRKSYKTQLERFRSLELPWEVYESIMSMCRNLGIDFMTSPFDLGILDQMAPHMPAVKIASGDLTYHQLIKAAVATGKPVILSTGMADLNEIHAAAALIPVAQRVLLHCVSVYPLPDDQTNLRAINALQAAFPDTLIGYSDHTIGPEACLAAVALGARLVEKHFTLDTSQRPGDHVLSLDPTGMAEMVKQIRRIEAMLGEPVKRPAPGEVDMRQWMRRGVYAAHELHEGTELSASDLLYVRPQSSYSPFDEATLVGRRALRSISAFEALSREALSGDNG